MNSVTRREALLGGLAIAPLLSNTALTRNHILAAPDLLSQESASGYRTLLSRGANLVVVSGDVSVPSWMKVHTLQGAVLIHELPVSPFHSSDNLYVRYHWPSPALVRQFGLSKPLRSENFGEPIAHLGTRPIAWRRSYGRGSIVTLASLLGPHVFAGDREALRLVAQITGLTV